MPATSYKLCVKDDVIGALEKANGDAILTSEPLVLRVQYLQLQDAQTAFRGGAFWFQELWHSSAEEEDDVGCPLSARENW